MLDGEGEEIRNAGWGVGRIGKAGRNAERRRGSEGSGDREMVVKSGAVQYSNSRETGAMVQGRYVGGRQGRNGWRY